ncbi:MAG: Trk system potassium transporter TrkA [Limisphaerales bacterium]
MNIVIVGMGEVGRHLAKSLSDHNHNLSLIESSEPVADELDERLDAQVVCGNGSSVWTLAEARVAEADLFMALSGDNDANLIAASLAKALGAKRTIARVHPRLQREEWLFDVRNHFHIDHLFSTQRLAAVELAKYIRNPEGLLVEEIARGRIEVQQVCVSKGLKVLGKPLREIGLPHRVRIGSIQRGSQLSIPSAADVIVEGDVVTLFGSPESLTEVVPRFCSDGLPEKEASVVIFGGGEYGFSLAQMLEGSRHRVRIIERDPRLCRYLSENLQRTVVIQGDATSVQQLKEEQVGDADFFIAASGDDEDNVMTCLQAKSLGTRYCLTLIHRADYADVISRNSQQLQIHAAVSPRESVLRELMRYITLDRSNTVLHLPGGAEILEAVIPETGPVAHHRISEVAWPEGSVLVALLHGSEASVPGPEDVMSPGDTIYALVSAEAKPAFSRLLKV